MIVTEKQKKKTTTKKCTDKKILNYLKQKQK